MRLDVDDDDVDDLAVAGTSVTVDIDLHINVHAPTHDNPDKGNGPQGISEDVSPKGLGSYSVSYLSHLGEITARTDEYL